MARPAPDVQRGTTTTEFAIVYALLLVLVLTVVHFGLVFHANLAVGDAADAALEAYQVEGGSAAVAVSAAESIVRSDRLLSGVSVSVSSDGEQVVVAVSASAPSLLPGLPHRVERTVSGPVERFIPEPLR